MTCIQELDDEKVDKLSPILAQRGLYEYHVLAKEYDLCRTCCLVLMSAQLASTFQSGPAQLQPLEILASVLEGVTDTLGLTIAGVMLQEPDGELGILSPSKGRVH